MVDVFITGQTSTYFLEMGDLPDATKETANISKSLLNREKIRQKQW